MCKIKSVGFGMTDHKVPIEMYEHVPKLLHDRVQLTGYQRQAHYITSSNVAKILGKNRYCSKKMLLFNLTRRIDDNRVQLYNNRQRRGVEAQSAILKLFMEEKLPGSGYVEYNKDDFNISKEHYFLATSIDAITSCGHIIEIKNPGTFCRFVPDRHILQLLFNLWVTGQEYGYVVMATLSSYKAPYKNCFNRGEYLFTYTRVKRDREWERSVMPELKDFLTHLWAYHTEHHKELGRTLAETPGP